MSRIIAPQPELADAGDLQDRVAAVLAGARAAGAVAAEAALEVRGGLSVGVRLGEVETVVHNRDRSLSVTVYFPGDGGLRKGSASTADLDRDALEATVEAACAIARHGGEDGCAGLADPVLLAADIPDLDLYHPWGLTVEDGIDLARECEGAARARDARITNSDGATVTSHDGFVLYANTEGFVGGYPTSRHVVRCTVIASDGAGMQRDHWYTVARRAGDLDAAGAVGRRAADRALARLGGRRLGTMRVPVLFAPEVAQTLAGHFVDAVSAGLLYRRASFLVDRRGERIFPEWLHIHEQPRLPGAMGSAPFDADGVATRDRDLVRDGVLQDYVLDSYGACRLGLTSTGNAGGVHNLTVEPGGIHGDPVSAMGRGLLVTELMGQGVQLVTGDYSRGAAGFWVEDGEIRYPIEEVTIAGNLAGMFANLVGVGADTDRRGNIRTGSWLVDAMTVAGE